MLENFGLYLLVLFQSGILKTVLTYNGYMIRTLLLIALVVSCVCIQYIRTYRVKETLT